MENKEILNESKGRLDVVLKDKLGQSRSRVAKDIRDGLVLVDGKAVNSCSFPLSGGERILLLPRKEEKRKDIRKAEGEDELDFVYKDHDIAVINKRRGIVVHPAPGHQDDTLVNYLAREEDFDFDLAESEDIRPGIVHRIDKDTSGLLVVALNKESQSVLQEEIRRHEFERLYLALCQGEVRDHLFRVDAPLTRPNHSQRKAMVDPIRGKEAITHFATLSSTSKVALLRCKLDTGRTHQIRAHLAYIHHPLIGDPLYNKTANPLADKGQALHAFSLSFLHPRTLQRMVFYAPLDEYMKELLRFFYR